MGGASLSGRVVSLVVSEETARAGDWAGRASKAHSHAGLRGSPSNAVSAVARVVSFYDRAEQTDAAPVPNILRIAPRKTAGIIIAEVITSPSPTWSSLIRNTVDIIRISGIKILWGDPTRD